MQVHNMRILTRVEIDNINREVVWEFGHLYAVVSGSVVELENGKTHHYIQLAKSDPERDYGILKQIGELIKDILLAKEVYYNGNQIA